MQKVRQAIVTVTARRNHMKADGNNVTIIVPTLNEVDNVTALTERIDKSMKLADISYKVLFIDDHSTDGTANKISLLSKKYPVYMQLKDGKQGKAQSVIQGFNSVTSRFAAMIDADLQYPPEAIPGMMQQLVNNNADVSLSERNNSDAGKLRNLMSSVFNFVFVQSLFGIKYDTQSGLKVFRQKVYTGMKLRPSPWAFDLEFIIAALQKRSKILTYNITFNKRISGEAKVNIIKSSLELAKSSILLRLRVPGAPIRDAYKNNMSYVYIENTNDRYIR